LDLFLVGGKRAQQVFVAKLKEAGDVKNAKAKLQNTPRNNGNIGESFQAELKG